MKKKEAINKFTSLYDATYDDAIAYTIGRTGSVDILSDVLKYTYNRLYQQLLKLKKYNLDEIKSNFFSYLNEAISKFDTSEKTHSDTVHTDMQYSSPDDFLNIELNISDDKAKELLLHKKIQSYIKTCSDTEKKVFYMFFYCGYEIEQISKLLNLQENQTTNLICTILNYIKSNFLEEYISQ